MKCPECKSTMKELPFEGRAGSDVAVDVCYGCRGLWFDLHESHQLSPAGTLRLFREMHGHRKERHPHPDGPRSCPRCDIRLVPTQDMAHNSRFHTSRCPEGHGHFITFFHFLREKGIARSLRPHELRELRKHVDTLLCSNCGEPMRLATLTACKRCDSPLSLLDPDCVETTVREAERDAGSRQNVAPEVAARLVMSHLKLAGFHKSPVLQSEAFPLVALSASTATSSTDSGWSVDLIDVGLEVVSTLVEGLIDNLFSS